MCPILYLAIIGEVFEYEKEMLKNNKNIYCQKLCFQKEEKENKTHY